MSLETSSSHDDHNSVPRYINRTMNGDLETVIENNGSNVNEAYIDVKILYDNNRRVDGSNSSKESFQSSVINKIQAVNMN